MGEQLKFLESKLNSLITFGQSVSRETELAILSQKISSQVTEMLGCERCLLFIIDRETDELFTKLTVGGQKTEIRIPCGKGIVGKCIKEDALINISDADKDSSYRRELDMLTGMFSRNLMVIPLYDIRGEAIGALEATNKIKGAFNSSDESMLKFISTFASSAAANSILYNSLKESRLETIYRMATIAEFRDQGDTAVHLTHISGYSVILAQAMNLPESEIEIIKAASPLHDIGKVAIPDTVLLKPGKLTEEEFNKMKEHTTFGAQMLNNAKTDLLKSAEVIALNHHEKFNGHGYPKGLCGKEIPLIARIVSVADVFDALCSKRVYKPAWEPEKARELIMSESGQSFDPEVVNAFMHSYSDIMKLYQSRADRQLSLKRVLR